MPWWSELAPELQADARALVAMVEAMGGTARVTSVRRSLRRERELAHGNLASSHADGRAFDVIVEPLPLARIAGLTWRRLGGRWSEADPVHFER